MSDRTAAARRLSIERSGQGPQSLPWKANTTLFGQEVTTVSPGRLKRSVQRCRHNLFGSLSVSASVFFFLTEPVVKSQSLRVKRVEKYLGLATADLFPLASWYRHSSGAPGVSVHESAKFPRNEMSCRDSRSLNRRRLSECSRQDRSDSSPSLMGATWSSYHHPASPKRTARPTSNKRRRAVPRAKAEERSF